MVNRCSTVLVLELTAGLLVLVISFVSTGAAIYFLIFSMLLSPQVALASLPQHNVTLRMDDFLIAIISLGWLARSAVYKKLGFFARTPLNRPILLYSTACVLATLFGMTFGKVRPLPGALFVVKYIEYFFVYFMVVNYIRNRRQVRNYFIAFAATAVIVSAYAIVLIPTGERIDVAFGGLSGEPNTFGAYLVFVISILGGVLLTQGSLRAKVMALAPIVLAAIPFLYTLSRSSWMAMAAMYASFMIFSRRIVPLSVLLVVVVLSMPMVMPGKVKQRYRETFMTRPLESPKQVKIGRVYLDESASERINSYKQILSDIRESPILGYGVTGYSFIDGQYFRTLIETGVVGLAAFLYLLYGVFATAFRAFRNSSDDLLKGLGLGMLAGTSALMAHAMSANTFIIVRIMEPFWLLAGLVVAGLLLEEPARKKAAANGADGRPQP